jgi:co-chaperonin GroES (HSP10)
VKRQDARNAKVRHIMPLGPRVLVRVIKEEDVAESGLYLPAGAKERMHEASYGEVIEVATPPGRRCRGTRTSGSSRPRKSSPE